MSRQDVNGGEWALFALLTYNFLVTIYLIAIGLGTEFVGVLLWPAAALHSVLTATLGHTWFKGRQINKA
jgi:hypothetical protein